MPDFRPLIARHTEEMVALHARLRETARARHRSDQATKDWKEALSQVYGHQSAVDDLLGRCLAPGAPLEGELRSFALSFLEVDPYYFRSGYTLDRLLQKIKRLDLTDAEICIVQAVIVRRIDTRALRNFRRLCRLIPLISTSAFVETVARRLRSDDVDVRRRAQFAMAYFPAHHLRETGA